MLIPAMFLCPRECFLILESLTLDGFLAASFGFSPEPFIYFFILYCRTVFHYFFVLYSTTSSNRNFRGRGSYGKIEIGFQNKINLKYMKGIRFNNFKNSPVGIFLSDLKEFGKEYSIDLLCVVLAGKGGNPYKIKRQLLGLTQKGYFDISKENNKTFFSLTPKGQNLAGLLKFSLGKLKWDKRWRVLIFDIPEREKYKRERLRDKLSELGFRQMQQSVWITPYPLPASFTDFVSELRVRSYLYALTVESINRENEFKKLFGIK